MTIEDVQSALVWTLTTQSIATVYLQVFQRLFDSSYSDIDMPSGVVAWWLVQFDLILRFDTANFSVSWYSVAGLRFMTADQLFIMVLMFMVGFGSLVAAQLFRDQVLWNPWT